MEPFSPTPTPTPYPASLRLLWPMTQAFYAAVDVKKNPKENPVSMATQLQLEAARPRGASLSGPGLEREGPSRIAGRHTSFPPSCCLRGTRPQTPSLQENGGGPCQAEGKVIPEAPAWPPRWALATGLAISSDLGPVVGVRGSRWRAWPWAWTVHGAPFVPLGGRRQCPSVVRATRAHSPSIERRRRAW